jgi:alkylation response protein AidB-like acyl-CoA dehydrogenase
VTLDFDEGDELRALRAAVADLGSRYGQSYFLKQARSGGHTDALWAEAGKAGFLGVNLPEEYGGGGGGMVELSIVLEELGAAGCPLLMMVVSPAICGTVIGRFGTSEQKTRWLPGLADGSITMGFAITEPDAGSNSHEITTVARRDGDEWVLNGAKVWISGVDQADALLVVGKLADSGKGTLRPALFVVPTDAAGLTAHRIPMEIVSPEGQFQVFLDDVRVPADALVGHPDQGIAQLFAGLNPERVMAAAYSLGVARLAMSKATDYARTRQVWGTPIGAHQGLAHPLAACQIEIECARLMTQKAAWLIDAGQDAGLAANSAKYAAAEAAVHAVD